MDPGISSSTSSSTVASSGSASAAVSVTIEPPPCVEPPHITPPHDEPNADDLWPKPEHVAASLKDLHARHPCITELVEIGRSHRGAPILALAVGRRHEEARPALLLDGAHHGDEPLSAGIVLDAARYLTSRAGRDPRVDRWLDRLVIWFVPLVNPDGLEAVTRRREGRKNGRSGGGVDLNRNYPFKWASLGTVGSDPRPTSRYYRGPSAGSEPETRAMMALSNAEVFVGAISYHLGAASILVPYTIDKVQDPTPNEAWAIATDVADGIVGHPNHPTRSYPLQRNLYPVDGTSPDWQRAAHGTVALLVEAGTSQSYLDVPKRAAVVYSIRGSWMALADRTLDGPSIGGVVRDARGRPVHAEVTLASIVLRENEHWMTRCRDGSFSRYVAEPGRQTVEVRLPGRSEPVLRREVEVRNSRVDLTLDLAEEIAPAPCPTRGASPK